MTASAQELIKTFDGLSESEQLEVAQEILRRLGSFDFPSLTDEDLVFSAEELFLILDQQEADHE